MRILFIGPTYVGDAVVSTGLADHLLREYPQARVTVACGAPAAPLFAAMPNCERVLVVRKRGQIGHWIDLWRACVGTRWDVVVDLRGSALSWFLRAGKRHVFRPNPRLAHRTHALAATLGLGDLPPPVMWTGPEHEATAARLLPPGTPILAVGPTGNWPPKIWPGERFAELARRLTAPNGPLPNGRIAVFAAAHERPIVAPILAALPPERTVDLVGRLDLTTVGAAMKRAALFIGNDSGPLYMAVACGIPTLGLFGPTPGLFPTHGLNPARWAPLACTVRTAEAAAIVTDRPVDGAIGRALMEGLTVDAVEQAARELLEHVQARTPSANVR